MRSLSTASSMLLRLTPPVAAAPLDAFPLVHFGPLDVTADFFCCWGLTTKFQSLVRTAGDSDSIPSSISSLDYDMG